MATKTLQQIHGDCISTAKLSPSLTVQKGNLYRWKGRVTCSVSAELKLHCAPHYGLVIVDQTAWIPCIIVDPVTATPILLALCGQAIIIRDPQFSVEIVVTESKQYDSVHLFLEPDNIKLPDVGPNITVAPLQIDASRCDASNDISMFNMVPQKISPAILTSKNEVICLILARLSYQNESDEKDVWLVLRNEQVIWKDFLIPNRNYTVHLPNDACLSDFKKYKSFHTIADKYLDLPHRQMLHHRDLIKTIAINLLPENSQILSNFALCNEISTEDWFSILDERLYKLKFASVYGIIKDINYLESWNMMNCPWCDPAGYIDRSESDSVAEKCQQTSSNHRWSSLLSKSSCKTADILHFPVMKAETPSNKVIGFGIRGGKINVQIILQEVSTNRMSYVFLKRWKMEQYPAGLMRGITVCFTDVNVKRSRKNNLYFVNTPLTRILHLNVFDILKDTSGSDWGEFEFPIGEYKDEKIWGVLELDMLAKVSIATKCKLCKETYVLYRCPNVFCSNHRKDLNEALYEVTATARLFVRHMEGYEASSLYLKNEHVQMYLDLSDKIWRKFCKLSNRSEIVYSHYFNDISSDGTDSLMICFYLYCKHFRSKNRFHVCCKRFKGDKSADRKYFCVDMKKVDSQRLTISSVSFAQNRERSEIASTESTTE